MGNPYEKEPKKGGQMPILSRLPVYEFSSAKAMEEELQPFETCIAKIPNHESTGYIEHVALVYKDGEDNVYSSVMMQHNGQLKEQDDVQEQSTNGTLEEEQSGSVREVQGGEHSTGSKSGESTGKSGESADYYSEEIRNRDYPEYSSQSETKSATTFKSRKPTKVQNR